MLITYAVYGVSMEAEHAVAREDSHAKTVTSAYDNDHILHINDETNGTHHKHSAEFSDLCPYCNEDIDYGMGIQL